MVVHALRAYKKGAEYSAPFLGTISELKGFYFVELEIYPPLEELPPVYHACGGWSSWPFAALGLLELRQIGPKSLTGKVFPSRILLPWLGEDGTPRCHGQTPSDKTASVATAETQAIGS